MACPHDNISLPTTGDPDTVCADCGAIITSHERQTQMDNCKACGVPLADSDELSTHCEGCESMAQKKQLPSNLWTIGTALADEVGIARTTLISAADRAAFPVVVLGCGSRAALRADVAAWVAGVRGMT